MKNKSAFSRLSAMILFFMAFMTSVIYSQTSTPKRIPDYSMVARSSIPKELTWNINDIYASDDAWKADKQRITEMLARVEPMSKSWTISAKNMFEMLELNKDISLTFLKLYSYASHQSAADMGNNDLQAMKGEVQSLSVKISSAFSFLNPDVLSLGKEKFDRYLKAEPGLEPYRYTISEILRNKDHVLPEDQQKLVSLTGNFAGSAAKAAKMLNDLEVPPAEVTLTDGKKVTLNVANFMVYRASKNATDRDLVMNTFFNNQKKFENTLATLLDGGIKEDWYGAQVAKFPDCLSARLFGDDISPAVYHMLIEQVKNNLGPLHRFMELKKKLLKLDKFRYADIYASSVPTVDKLYTYEEARDIVLQAVAPLGSDYVNVLKTAFTSRWIDVYPNKGKESGAYSGGVYGVHPFVKMNFNGKYDAVSTLAHELGHSMHSYLSEKHQDFVNSDYPTFLAEIASTFNENMLVQYLLKTETDDLFKLYLLDSYLDQVRSTLYRQTLFAEFDLAMHQRVESGKSLTPDFLDNLYLDLTRTYYGHDKGVCEVGDYIKVEWSRVPHFYRDYYVFQYSTGIIASLALSNMVLNGGPDAQKRYLELLSAGGSDHPISLLQKAGVDMTTAAPYQAAIKRFDQLVTEMEAIVARLKL